jgi:adenosylmethionine---8-amino-7-oxononanoate aminotransferase
VGDSASTLDALETAYRKAPAVLTTEPLFLGAGGILLYLPALLAAMAAI